MTGQDIIAWIKENNAEDLECFVIDDAFALMGLRPTIVENKSLLDYQGDEDIEPSKTSIVLYGL
jgi:hypothetical protein